MFLEMQAKDLALLLILSMVLHGVSLTASAIMLERFAPMSGGMKSCLVLYAGLSGIGMFFGIFALIMKPSGLTFRISAQVWVFVTQFCVGMIVAGISFNRRRYWMDWRTSKDTTMMPSIFLGVASLVQLMAAFFFIRAKERVKEWKLDEIALSHLLCGSEFAVNSDDDDDEEAQLVEDMYYGKAKPTFHNRKQRRKQDFKSSEEDDGLLVVEEVVTSNSGKSYTKYQNASPKRVKANKTYEHYVESLQPVVPEKVVRPKSPSKGKANKKANGSVIPLVVGRVVRPTPPVAVNWDQSMSSDQSSARPVVPGRVVRPTSPVAINQSNAIPVVVGNLVRPTSPAADYLNQDHSRGQSIPVVAGRVTTEPQQVVGRIIR